MDSRIEKIEFVVDGPNDKSSNLDRDGVFRISFNIPKDEYVKMFGEKPKRPRKGITVNVDYDFSQRNKLMPHAVYGWMNWVMILSPTIIALKNANH